jgi:hypothetical protein
MQSRETFAVLGCVFEIRSPDSNVRREISARLPPDGRSFSGAPLRRYSVERDGDAFVVRRARRRPVRAGDAAAAAELVVEDLEVALSRAIEGCVLVHAGAVRWNGGAILLPGRSGVGKSELVEALVRAGAGYLSDEFAVLDRRGRVHPYRRPIALRRSSGIRRTRVAATDHPALPVSLIAFLRYREGAPWRPTPLTPGAAILGLLRNTLSCAARLDDARPILRRVVAGAAFLKGLRPDADRTAEMLLGGA